MEGLSGSDFRKADDSRDLSTSGISDRNLRLLHASRISLSADASRDSLFGTGRKARDPVGQAPSDHIRNWSGASVGDLAEDPFSCGIEWGDVSLRKWLDNPERAVVASECLHIFRQIVEIVSTVHSQGIVVNNVRPSCFVMSSFNHVSFIESASCSDSGSDSPDEGLNCQKRDKKHSSPPTSGSLLNWGSKFPLEGFRAEMSTMNASQHVSETSCCLMSSSGHVPVADEMQGRSTNDCVKSEKTEDKESFPMKKVLLMENSWYTSPEEIAGAPSSCASDLYRFGVLLFELFCTFTSMEEKSRTMNSLRHRVLPPELLLKWPKEASFCLWLLHPDPSSRPKMGDLLQSEFLNDPRDDIEEREAGIELREKIEEQELLMDFLMMIRQTKQEAADKLHDTISLLTSDIQEILSKQRVLKKKGDSSLGLDENLFPLDMTENEEATSGGSRKRVRPGQKTHSTADFDSNGSQNNTPTTEVTNPESLLTRNSRLMKNFKKLESAYLLTRCRPTKPAGKLFTGRAPLSSNSRGSVVLTEKSGDDSLSNEAYTKDVETEWISPFLEGLCKYLSFTELKVKADLKQGDLLNSSNLVCSVSFDRDGEFFAVAGVNKKIKIFECDSILNEERDMHYPVVEMASRSRLSSVCWNSYIKSQIASSNFDGVVQVWDAARSQIFMELKEHERRVWSVDFSLADPTLLASGSDDGSVKLWSINQGTSIETIKTKANVCCVQFPSDTGRSLAFGSADHRVYYYDLRYPKVPLHTLVGHNKTVSYVKFIDSKSLVSASTDNTIKLWDLSMCSSRVLDAPCQTYTGHTNMKNFVGLSVSDGYIATGSETNEVFVYHKALPMPALSFKLSSTDSHSGHEVDDNAQFISSVCWRGQSSSTLVAANSTGDIRLLEMV